MSTRERFLSEVSSLIDGEGTSFTGYHFRELCKPCVYVFLENGKVLYIGLSSNGIARAAQRSHHQAESRLFSDEVRIFPCRSLEDAEKLESVLIYGLRPVYNKRKRLQYVKALLGNR